MFRVVLGERQRSCKNSILGKETGKQRHTSNGQGTHQHGPISNGHFILESAHVAHILGIGLMIAFFMEGMVHGMDHRTGTVKQVCLKHGMGQQMKKCCGVNTSAHCQYHIAQLTYGGVS